LSSPPPGSPLLSLGTEEGAAPLTALPTEVEAEPLGLRLGTGPHLEEAATVVSLRPPPPPQAPALAGPALDEMRTLVSDSPFAALDEEQAASGELKPERRPARRTGRWTQLLILLMATLAVGLAVGVWLANC
jgi:hypothetical protein